MKVLVTGSAGRVGRAVLAALGDSGHDGIEFDAAYGHDVLDRDAIVQAAAACHAVVHAAAIPNDGLSTPDEVMRVNVLGTWCALLAAREARHATFVFISSIQATGVSQSHRPPDYLPLDDDHTDYPVTPYALSKLLGEQACASFTRTFGMATVCLRPPTVLGPDEYDDWHRRRIELTELNDPFWNYGSWIDSRDLARAVVAALRVEGLVHERLLVTADDISSFRPGREVVEERYPGLDWRGGPAYDDAPFRSLVDCTRAKRFLGWRPEHEWQRWLASPDRGTSRPE